MVILLNDIKNLSLPLQDVMLCGGSDAAIIPIGILFLRNLFGLHEVILASINVILIQQSWCRLGWLCSMQGSLTKK